MVNTKELMTDFSQKRFVDIGQTLYVEWLENLSTSNNAAQILNSRTNRKQLFKQYSEMAFEAAEEFTKVFAHQEDN